MTNKNDQPEKTRLDRLWGAFCQARERTEIALSKHGRLSTAHEEAPLLKGGYSDEERYALRQYITALDDARGG